MPDPLTVAHRRRVDQVRRDTAAQLALLWTQTFDVDDVDGSWTRFVSAAFPIIQDGYDLTAQDAVSYLQQFRRKQNVPGRLPDVSPSVLGRLRVQRSLEYTSKIVTLRAIQVGRTPTQAARAALVRTIGASGRFVTEGSHTVVREAVRRDRQAVGWVRVTSFEPCPFCAMLAARGPVYQSEATASFRAHDHCACTAEPLYGEWKPDAHVRQWVDLYDREARGTRDPLKAFRDAYRRHQRIAADPAVAA